MTPDDGASSAIDAIWRSSRGEIGRRISTVEEAVCALRSQRLDDGLRGRALCDAHKLTGALGMFGFTNGSVLSRELEQGLELRGEAAHGAGPQLTALVHTLRREFDARA